MKQLRQTIRPSTTSSRRNDRGDSYKGHVREVVDMANIAEHGADVLWRARRGEVSRYMLHMAGAEHEDFRCPMDIKTSKKDAAKVPTRQSKREAEIGRNF